MLRAGLISPLVSPCAALVPLLVLGSFLAGCKCNPGASRGGAAANGRAVAPAQEGGSAAAASADNGIVVYSGRSEKLVSGAIAAFEQASGVKVSVKYADTAQLAATLMEEGKRSPADVFIAQDASTLQLLEDRGVFASLPGDVVSRVDPRFRSSSSRWVALTGRARVLAYAVNQEKSVDLPASVDELTQPQWKGLVGWAPENASFQSFVAAMVLLRGEDATRTWLTAMHANAPRAYPSNTPAVLAVSRGEIAVALTNHYYLYRLREEHGAEFPVANHYFKNGHAESLVNVSGAGVIASTSHGELARRFVAYLLSAEGQAHFVQKNHEFPTATGVASPDGLPAIELLQAPEMDYAKLGDLGGAVKLLRDVGALQ